MKKPFNSGYKPSSYTHISNTEYLAIIENDDCGVLKIMSFNTERENWMSLLVRLKMDLIMLLSIKQIKSPKEEVS